MAVKPYVVRCNQCRPTTVEEFDDEDKAQQWIHDHNVSKRVMNIGAAEHNPRMARKVILN